MIPLQLSQYSKINENSLYNTLVKRLDIDGFAIIALLIFIAALIHTFLSSYIKLIYSRILIINNKKVDIQTLKKEYPNKYLTYQALKYLSEIELVFGIWVVVLIFSMCIYYNFKTMIHYINHIKFEEPIFIFVILLICSTKPIMFSVKLILDKTQILIFEHIGTTWIIILVICPILGSLITEPAAMIVSANLLSDRFYILNPSKKLKYITLSLLLVNISIGGTMTNFAAPPILMVAEKWGWSSSFIMQTFGIKSIIGMIISISIVYIYFIEEFRKLNIKSKKIEFKNFIIKKYFQENKLIYEMVNTKDKVENDIQHKENIIKALNNKCNDIVENFSSNISGSFNKELGKSLLKENIYEYKDSYIESLFKNKEYIVYKPQNIPLYVIIISYIFLLLTIFSSHYISLMIIILIAFVGFANITSEYQNPLDWKGSLLVFCFLGGLVVHSNLQAWWLEPIILSLGDNPLIIILSVILTSFNDNAAITYLSSLVPNISDISKYYIVAGALIGGGLTIIANAPNPIGISILKKHFKDLSFINIFLASLLPTIILILVFLY